MSPAKKSWCENRLKKKGAAYYVDQRGNFEDSFKGNEFLTLTQSLEDINTRIVSLLTSYVKTRKLIGVRNENMEETLKTLRISPKVLARRTNALWNILLPTEQQGKELTGSVLNTNNLSLLGVRKMEQASHLRQHPMQRRFSWLNLRYTIASRKFFSLTHILLHRIWV